MTKAKKLVTAWVLCGTVAFIGESLISYDSYREIDLFRSTFIGIAGPIGVFGVLFVASVKGYTKIKFDQVS